MVDFAEQARAHTAEIERRKAAHEQQERDLANRIAHVLEAAGILARELARLNVRPVARVEKKTLEQKYRTTVFGGTRPDGWQTRTELLGTGWLVHKRESYDNEIIGAGLTGQYIVLTTDGAVWHTGKQRGSCDEQPVRLAAKSPYDQNTRSGLSSAAIEWSIARDYILANIDVAFAQLIAGNKIDPSILEPKTDSGATVECLDRSYPLAPSPADRVERGANEPGAVGFDRAGQLRYLFLSWLSFVGGPRDGVTLGPGERIAWPEGFLTGRVQSVVLRQLLHANRSPLGFAPRVLPVPMLPGGPVQRDEVAALVHRLLMDGHVRWIPTKFDARQHAVADVDDSVHGYSLGLTDAARATVDEVFKAYASEERRRLRRIAMMRWVGDHERSERRTEVMTMADFLGSPASVIDGVASSVIDAGEVAVWLASAGFITSGGTAPDAAVAGLTQRGFVCVDRCGCDPMATPLYGAPTEHKGEASSNVVRESPGAEPDDGYVAGLRGYAEAVLALLPDLGLEERKRHAVEVMSGEIRELAESAEPDVARLRALGTALKIIVDGFATGALAVGLASLWPQ